MKYRVHKVAEMFPLMSGRDYRDLEQDIEVHGQHEPIIVDGDVLLDGRNRLAVCEALRIEPKIVEWRDLGIKVTQWEWIFSKNMERRHLTPDQRTAISASFITFSSRETARAAKESAQFRAGDDRQNPGGKPVVTPDSASPQKRDRKKSDANSTAGRVATAAGTSRYKASMAVKLVEAAATDPEAAAQLEEVKKGLRKLSAATPRKPRKWKLQTAINSFKKLWDKCPKGQKDEFSAGIGKIMDV